MDARGGGLPGRWQSPSMLPSEPRPAHLTGRAGPGGPSGAGDLQHPEAHLVGRALAPHDVAVGLVLEGGQLVAQPLDVAAGDLDLLERLEPDRVDRPAALVVEVPH